MLSDACFDFLGEFERAAQKLAEAVHWYSSPDFGHMYGEEIDSLRRACVRVRSDPQDIDAWVALLRFATTPSRTHLTRHDLDQEGASQGRAKRCQWRAGEKAEEG